MIAQRIDETSDDLKLEVLKSAAGFYIGTFDYDSENYGPVSRVSEYFKTREEAEHALNNNCWTQR
ncbi:hypothetical protein [Acinetobacter seifertii]|uniref:hypothetical protein n=1 Tax=Acinetobacter seifertii TaxID=1530123 RepID=UPI000C22335C|nr:hypothetical protein [Acinetobacter seifertii]PJG65166.1 hypothetical protein CVD09_17740 [Acinetobacter seifertii]